MGSSNLGVRHYLFRTVPRSRSFPNGVKPSSFFLDLLYCMIGSTFFPQAQGSDFPEAIPTQYSLKLIIFPGYTHHISKFPAEQVISLFWCKPRSQAFWSVATTSNMLIKRPSSLRCWLRFWVPVRNPLVQSTRCSC